MPFLGCDGLPKTGQAWVRRNLLAATIVIPPNADLAIEMMVRAIASGALPPERTYTTAKSFPAIEVLANYPRHTRVPHPANWNYWILFLRNQSFLEEPGIPLNGQTGESW
jgi:hypothetical protein